MKPLSSEDKAAIESLTRRLRDQGTQEEWDLFYADLCLDHLRLRYLCKKAIPEALGSVEKDVYEYACDVADEKGRADEEPTDEEFLEGFRRMLDAARRG